MADQQDWKHLKRYAGKWIAWNRGQTHIVAIGDTFEAVKAAAAEHGEQSVLVAEIPAEQTWLRRSGHFFHVFAVFIALSQPIGGSVTSVTMPIRSAQEIDLLDESLGDER